ncbi:hemerythrin domain-containing protein [Streptomyces sp. TLI_146]|uniref:hemerythrin domain-containing protein n=1 Tax=Streptomyces sp. TLI_146 TaxID=1938858 RepID=UPI000C70155C|nr:hemerythrin domain-containing protein [Streptomyces sp. TLI_146]PKV83387.1 hemerythrin HHE cation binding domain-containing protein [Streptomyces sp. TLI_146]
MSTDAIVMLREGHKEIRRLIHSYRAERDASLIGPFLRALTVYTYIEREGMYPRVGILVPETEPDILDFTEEHHIADVLAAELYDMRPDAVGFDAKARLLMDIVERHMDAEDHRWFPRVRAALGRKELREIGAWMATLAERAPQRPRRPSSQMTWDTVAA